MGRNRFVSFRSILFVWLAYERRCRLLLAVTQCAKARRINSAALTINSTVDSIRSLAHVCTASAELYCYGSESES